MERLRLRSSRSDLSISEARYLRGRWSALPVSLRQQIVALMATLGDEDVRFNFERALHVALSDSEPEVRLAGVVALWEAESTSLLDALLDIVDDESSERVRIAIVEALGRFARLAMEGRISEDQQQRVNQKLVDIALNETDEDVWLAALAAAAYLRSPALESRIFQTYDEGHDEAREIALRAMGRYGGSQWASRVIDSIRAGDADQRTEAARAAPYVEDRRVVPYLYEAAEDDEEADLQLAAVAALGEIGGPEVRSFLEELRDSTTGDVLLAAETALANAQLLDGVGDASPI
ncbi:MAG: HEAT repeat domain-containing protein [Thermomicrobiales bacterium]